MITHNFHIKVTYNGQQVGDTEILTVKTGSIFNGLDKAIETLEARNSSPSSEVIRYSGNDSARIRSDDGHTCWIEQID